MCGRYTIHADADAIIRRFLLGRVPAALRPRYNVAPTQTVPVVRLDDGGQRIIQPMRWGLVPSWATDPAIGSRMINARAESLAEKPAFRDALKHRRCLVIADGFYEWRKDPGGKTPMYIRRRDGEPLAFAGLWESWADSSAPLTLNSALKRIAVPGWRPWTKLRMPPRSRTSPPDHVRWASRLPSTMTSRR